MFKRNDRGKLADVDSYICKVQILEYAHKLGVVPAICLVMSPKMHS